MTDYRRASIEREVGAATAFLLSPEKYCEELQVRRARSTGFRSAIDPRMGAYQLGVAMALIERLVELLDPRS